MDDDRPRRYVKVDRAYWAGYSNLQHGKHELIRHYLGGWFAKLGSWAGRVVYVDTHAGRGRHASGELGSPLVALNTLLKHPHRDRLLKKSEFVFWFIERDEQHLAALRGELEALGQLPEQVRTVAQAGNCFDPLQKVLESLREHGSRMPPAFIFLDPYGFKLPGSLLRDLMKAGRVELLVTFMWRYVNMAIAQAKEKTQSGVKFAETLDDLFESAAWRSRIVSYEPADRAKQAAELLRERIGARWFTNLSMLGENEATQYLLLHFTNHDAGRDLMKSCVRRIVPHGSGRVRKREDPRQGVLIAPEPDLGPLRSWACQRLRKPVPLERTGAPLKGGRLARIGLVGGPKAVSRRGSNKLRGQLLSSG